MVVFNYKENCNKLKAKFMQLYSGIAEEDIHCSNGRKEEMLEKLQQKLGKTGEELREIILKL